MSEWLRGLNIISECKALRWRLRECPPFLFLLMGFVTIVSMLATYALATRYVEEPEFAALIVIFVTALLFALGTLIIDGFNKIAEANRMKAEFISLTSHQLRSPLAIFKWTLDTLGRDLGENAPEKVRSSLEALNAAAEQMIQIVNSLLEVSRIEARTFVLKKETFRLEDLTRKAIDTFKKYADASGIAINFKPSEAPLPEIVSDLQRVGMVIQNLLDNAIRYTPGPGQVSIRIEKYGAGGVKWSVSDTGSGIPDSEQKNIFQKFFRARNNKNSQVHGTGVGLYIAKEIVKAAGGRIGFTSQEGKGSTFWFILPIK